MIKMVVYKMLRYLWRKLEHLLKNKRKKKIHLLEKIIIQFVLDSSQKNMLLNPDFQSNSETEIRLNERAWEFLKHIGSFWVSYL